jgi:hypothetical protein
VVASGGNINGPNALTSINGFLYVADINGGTPNLVEINLSNNQQRVVTSGGSLIYPTGLVPGPNNNVYWADQYAGGGGAIFSINVTTGMQTLITQNGNLSNVIDVGLEASGNLIVVSAGNGTTVPANVTRVTPTGGQVRLSYGGLVTVPNGVTVDATRDGSIYLTSNTSPSRVVGVNPSSGAQRSVSSNTNLNFLTGITVYNVGGGGAVRSAGAPQSGQQPNVAATVTTTVNSLTAGGGSTSAGPGSAPATTPTVPLVSHALSTSATGPVVDASALLPFLNLTQGATDAVDSIFARWENGPMKQDFGRTLLAS